MEGVVSGEYVHPARCARVSSVCYLMSTTVSAAAAWPGWFVVMWPQGARQESPLRQAGRALPQRAVTPAGQSQAHWGIWWRRGISVQGGLPLGAGTSWRLAEVSWCTVWLPEWLMALEKTGTQS